MPEEIGVWVEIVRYVVPSAATAFVAWVVARAGQSHEVEREVWKKRQEDIGRIAERVDQFLQKEDIRFRETLGLATKLDKESEDYKRSVTSVLEVSKSELHELAFVRARCVLLGFYQ